MSNKALLVVSFGTTYHDTREKTLDAISGELQSRFPSRVLYEAWTSSFIRRKLLERDGFQMDSVTEAMERMKQDGMEDVLIQPTHIIEGAEFQKILDEVIEYDSEFRAVRIGRPLLCCDEDLTDCVEALIPNFPDMEEERALVFLGHGSPDGNNGMYPRLEETFHRMGYPNVFIGTVEGEPDLSYVLELVRTSGCSKVTLAPLLVVAGDHALNDLAGEEPDSWASVFRSEGFQTECVLRGIGEYPEIRKIYVKHARNAMMG